MKKFSKIVFLSTLFVGLTSCSLTQIKKDKSVSGTSIDVLRNSESISIAGISKTDIKVKIMTKSGKECLGTFMYKSSYKGYMGISDPKNVYYGKFSPASSSCKDALGENTGNDIALVHFRTGGIFSSAIMGKEFVRICKEKDNHGLCNPHNTFSLSESK
ncbi:hypothetical protein A9Q84_16865 [Halobacteriovorax marinus]|uniref:Lipoprotein n=1 Tax=Halobacteriovorax marinus TaxID=97084 RepID=A0A1Y5F4W5_9BACT|nr:hypothetical protein A9Q84_16865 [Halobacteriovorax marinus]